MLLTELYKTIFYNKFQYHIETMFTRSCAVSKKTRLQNILLDSFGVMQQSAILLCGHVPYHFLNTPLLDYPQTLPERKVAFLGKNMCGPYSFVAKYILEKHGFSVKVWQNQQGYGDYATDHTFLVVDDMYFVDTTYRQVLECNSEDTHCPYFKRLHYGLPPFFVGTYDELSTLCVHLEHLHRSHYGRKVGSEFNMEHNKKRWTRQNDVSQAFTMPCETANTVAHQPDAYNRELFKQIQQIIM